MKTAYGVILRENINEKNKKKNSTKDFHRTDAIGLQLLKSSISV